MDLINVEECAELAGGDQRRPAESDPSAAPTPAGSVPMRPLPLLYASVGLIILPSLQVGWATGQLNYTGFHSTKDCSARPIQPGTCLLFPGHTALEWTLIVNVWIAMGTLGCFLCGRLSESYGRKRLAIANAILIVIGALLQSLAPTPSVFILGRLCGGMAAGIATAMANGYISEIAPPHLRSQLGALYLMSTGAGLVLVNIALVVVAATPSGWRLLAAAPILWCGPMALAAPSYLVESPTWLLLRGRQEEAKRELARLFGQEHVPTALGWHTLSSSCSHTTETSITMRPLRDLFSRPVRHQTLLALSLISLITSLEMAGINAVFLYSSSMFRTAGLQDPRIGSLIVAIVYLLPSFVSGHLGTRYGSRNLILGGHAAMIVWGVAVSMALWSGRPWLSISCLSSYVVIYASGFAPISYVTLVSLFPAHLRAHGSGLVLSVGWGTGLVVGITYPYVADALGPFGLAPFTFVLVLFFVINLRFLPDTTGKTTDEIQALFASTECDADTVAMLPLMDKAKNTEIYQSLSASSQ